MRDDYTTSPLMVEDNPAFPANAWLDDDDDDPNLLAAAVQVEANYARYEQEAAA